MEEWNNDNPLKIIMTADTIGGVWFYSIDLCRALQKYPVHFYLVTTGAPLQPCQKSEVEQLKNVTVYQTNFLLEWMESPWQSIVQSGRWLLQLANELQPHLIHLNSYCYGSLPWKVPVVIVAHSDVFSWWLAVKKSYPPAQWNEYFKRVFRGLQQADFIVAPSKVTLSQVRKLYYAVCPGKVIYNGRSSDVFYPGKKQPVICSVGRIWDEAKNIRLLAEAAKLIPYKVRLSGDTGFQQPGHYTAGPNITCLGRLSSRAIAAELSVASVYVLPARYEPFGLSILEAALSGCALVLGKIGSLKEIWGDSALYVDTDNAVRLSKTISNLMENDEYRLHYARQALSKAKTYTVSQMAASYLEVYQSLLKSKHQLITDK